MRRFFFISSLIFMLVACSPYAATQITPSIQASTTLPTMSNFSIPTSTHQISSLSTPTTTITLNPRFTQQCLTVDNNEIELNKVASGTILKGKLSDGHPFYVLENILTGKEYKLPGNTASSIFVSLVHSPNLKWLAQQEVIYNKLGIATGNEIRTVIWVFNAQADVVTKMAIDRKDLTLFRWLDDERLIFETKQYGVLLVVNPFTGEQQEISTETPNLAWYSDPGWPVVYSPNLEQVAYYAVYNAAIKGNRDAIEGPTIYDTVKKQILWNGNKVGSVLVWSPDGKEGAFIGGTDEYQLYLLEASGQVKAVLDESLPHDVRYLSWSPNGRYIVFLNGDSLMIYDRQTDWVFDTCISHVGTPFWSPDSRQVIMTPEGLTTELLVDWQAKKVYTIKEISKWGGFGWMHSIP